MDEEAAEEEWSEERIRLFVEQLHEGAEVGKKLAAARTQRDQLGQMLMPWVDLLDATLGMATSQQAEVAQAKGIVWEHAGPEFPTEYQTVDERAWRGAPSSLAERDLMDWRAAGWPWSALQPSHQQDRGPVLHLGRRMVEASMDHLRGLAVLMQDERVTRSPLVLARVVLDGVAHVFQLIDLEITSEERLRRAFNEVLARAGDDYASAAREGDSDGMVDAEAEIEAMFTAAEGHWPCTWNKVRRRSPYLGEPPASTAKMIDLLLEGASLWGLLSGAVHNKEDEGWRIMLGAARFDNPHRGSYVALHTLGAILGIVKLTEALETYTGWDLSPVRQNNQSLCELWADGGGMFDEMRRTIITSAEVTS